MPITKLVEKINLVLTNFHLFDTTIHKLGIVVNRRRKEVTCFCAKSIAHRQKKSTSPQGSTERAAPVEMCHKGALLKTTSLSFYHTRGRIAISAAIRIATGSGARENDTGKDLEFESRRNYWRCQLALHKAALRVCQMSQILCANRDT